MSPIDHNTLAALTAGGAHRAHVSFAEIAQRDTDRAGAPHGRRCGGPCCAIPRPRGQITAELAAVRARLDRIAGRAVLVLPFPTLAEVTL